MTVRDAVVAYAQRGWQPLLLRPRDKRPLDGGWATAPPTVDELLTRLDGREYNLGLLLGAPSGGLVDVDLDSPEARALASRLLPPTAAVFGRASAPASHWLYQADPVPESRAYQAPDGRMLLELRADRHQTMVPPSVHPSGEPVRWERDGEPGRVTAEELLQACARLAAAALLARHWPAPGSRQETALALAGALGRLGWPAHAVEEYVLLVAEAGGDEEARKRAAAARDTVAKLETGEPTTGWRRLAELLDPSVVRCVRRWLEPAQRRVGPYQFGSNGIAYIRETAHGLEARPLANFTAEIEEAIVTDDGAETRRVFVVTGRVGDTPLPPLRVPAERFATLAWTAEWAPRAVLYAGQTTRDRVREAIQLVSLDAPERVIYTHTGWRQVGGRWLYLHAGGALGADGPAEGISVELPQELARYRLAEPPDAETLRAAVATVWQELPAVAPTVYAAVFGAAVTAPLATLLDVDAAVWVAGATGLFKTSLVSLLLNLYGEFPPTTAPAGFESTANYLEKLAFLAKDLPLLIDDVRPPQSMSEAAEWRRKVERLVRAVGNRTGRGRMAGDTTLQGAYPPRALVIVTGEDEIEGSSTIGRTLLVRFEQGTVDPQTLRRWQHDPVPLRLTGAGYVRWLAGLLDRHGPARFRALRDGLPIPELPSGLHPRLATTLRQLLTGWTLYAWFATETGAVSEAAANRRLDEVAASLAEHAVATGEEVRAQRPSHRFVQALGDLMASRRASLVGRDGKPPSDAEALGWVALDDGTLVPRGERVGWVDEDGLYLIPSTARALVGRLLRESGEVFAISSRRLLEELERDGYLLPTSHRGPTRAAVIKAEGKTWRVWALRRLAVERQWGHKDPEGA